MELAGTLLAAAVAMAIPLLYAALGELLAEKAGIVNVGLEGFLLLGAFTAFAVAHQSGSSSLAIAGALALGGSTGAAFAFFIVARKANQIVAGTALNLFAAGATAVLYRSIFGVTGAALTVPATATIEIPGLASLPVVGTAFFRQTALGYLCFLAVPAIAFFLARTRAGLGLKMTGENPRAAATQGVRVDRVRALALIACGGLCAAGGAYLAIDYTQTFVEGMSAGRGFIALAIVIVGRRLPWWTLAAALFFGFATALQFHFQALSLGIPFHFFLILPYVVTLLLLALAPGDSNAPAALGRSD